MRREERNPCRIWNTWRRICVSLCEGERQPVSRRAVHHGGMALPAGLGGHIQRRASVEAYGVSQNA